jgi:hypothetical protein
MLCESFEQESNEFMMEEAIRKKLLKRDHQPGTGYIMMLGWITDFVAS